MKLKITMPKAHGADGKPLKVGDIITVEGDTIPGYLTNKAVVWNDDIAKATENLDNLKTAVLDAETEANTHETDKEPAAKAGENDPKKQVNPADAAVATKK